MKLKPHDLVIYTRRITRSTHTKRDLEFVAQVVKVHPKTVEIVIRTDDDLNIHKQVARQSLKKLPGNVDLSRPTAVVLSRDIRDS